MGVSHLRNNNWEGWDVLNKNKFMTGIFSDIQKNESFGVEIQGFRLTARKHVKSVVEPYATVRIIKLHKTYG